MQESGSRGGRGGGGLERLRFREGEEDVGVVPEYDFGDGHRAVIVGVETGQLRGEVAVLHHPQRREYHRYAERYEAQAADGGDELVSSAVAVFGLPGGDDGHSAEDEDVCVLRRVGLAMTLSRKVGSVPCSRGENVGRGRSSSILTISTILSECAVLSAGDIE